MRVPGNEELPSPDMVPETEIDTQRVWRKTWIPEKMRLTRSSVLCKTWAGHTGQGPFA